MTVYLEVSDLQIFAPDIDPDKAQEMINDALADASRVAPCINDVDFPFEDAAKALIRRAILRWNEVGAGGLTTEQQMAGPFSLMTTVGTRAPKSGLFWPSEIADLQSMCSNSRRGKAFTTDTAPPGSGAGRSDSGVWTNTTTWLP